MRVLAVGNMYPPHHLGGYELMCRAAVAHLRARGDEVRVLVSDHREEAPEPTIPEDPDIHRELRWYWRAHRFPRLGLLERARLERHNLALLDRHLLGFRPDAVSWWAMGGMSMSLIELVRRRGVPAVGFVHDEWLGYGPRVDAWHRMVSRAGVLGGLAERATGIPSRVSFAEAAVWAFVSEATRRHALAARGALPRTAIAHSGVDRELFSPQPERPWEGRLLYVGRIDPRKGVATAVRALSHLRGATLTVLGGGDDAHVADLVGIAAELGLRDRVSFERRSRQELPAAYGASDAVVFPVLWEEPWGLVPLEAMASGRPVLATGTGGSAEFLRDGENCVLFAPRDDPRALARGIERLAGDAALRARLREGGFATARRIDQASFERAVGRLLDQAVADGGPGGSG